MNVFLFFVLFVLFVVFLCTSAPSLIVLMPLLGHLASANPIDP